MSQSRIPIAPSLTPTLKSAHIGTQAGGGSKRTLFLCLLAVGIALAAALVAQGLSRLIALITNLSFYQKVSFDWVAPGNTPSWGPWVIAVPVIGGIIVGLMARYGSKAIRGHGIPEAMEQILLNESRIPVSVTFLKPISAAISIGTGGPFGAEGPIIATGGALGSVLGQMIRMTSQERKILLAAGAAAGMSATFGTPVSAVLLAIELLLFEFRPQSVLPVALAAAAAAAARIPFAGTGPVFNIPNLSAPSGSAIAIYIALGLLIGVFSVLITKLVYWIEDAFEEFVPVHWMWWPALGGIAVGVIGYIEPGVLGVGYENIEKLLAGQGTMAGVLFFCAMKLLCWSISLGSGTSGGTLAPLMTVGGGIGLAAGLLLQNLAPGIGVNPAICALVGMAGLFAGASRALLASIVFAFEATQQPFGLLPLLGGCTASFLVSSALMKTSIMTEKINRRGVRVPNEYVPDFLEQVEVRNYATKHVRTLLATQTVASAREQILTPNPEFAHQGYPVVDESGALVGIVTKRDLLENSFTGDATLASIASQPPLVAFEDNSLREAADLMTTQGIGRLPVVDRKNPSLLKGILTRSDLLRAHQNRLASLVTPVGPKPATESARI